MTHNYNLYDLVILKSDEEKEPMQIVSITHYPTDSEPSYQLWATEHECLVGDEVSHSDLLPLNQE